MRITITTLYSVLTFTCCGIFSSSAVPIAGLFNTSLDGSRNYLPTGLRVDQIRGKFNLIPKPGSCVLAAIGIGGLLVQRRI